MSFASSSRSPTVLIKSLLRFYFILSLVFPAFAQPDLAPCTDLNFIDSKFFEALVYDIPHSQNKGVDVVHGYLRASLDSLGPSVPNHHPQDPNVRNHFQVLGLPLAPDPRKLTKLALVYDNRGLNLVYLFQTTHGPFGGYVKKEVLQKMMGDKKPYRVFKSDIAAELFDKPYLREGGRIDYTLRNMIANSGRPKPFRVLGWQVWAERNTNGKLKYTYELAFEHVIQGLANFMNNFMTEYNGGEVLEVPNVKVFSFPKNQASEDPKPTAFRGCITIFDPSADGGKGAYIVYFGSRSRDIYPNDTIPLQDPEIAT